MPMEHIRQRLAQNPALYPQLARVGPPQDNMRHREPISVGSTSSATSSVASSAPRRVVPAARRNRVVLSSSEEEGPSVRRNARGPQSDEEDESESDDEVQVIEPAGPPPPAYTQRPTLPNQAQAQPRPPVRDLTQVQPHTRPAVRDLTQPRPPQTNVHPTTTLHTGQWKNPPVPVKAPAPGRPGAGSGSQYPYGAPIAPSRPTEQTNNNYIRPPVGFPSEAGPYMGMPNSIPEWLDPKEAEKAVKDLLEGAVAGDDAEEIEIDMSKAIVPGFKEGFELLPHQILGREWMKGREVPPKTGGILADDMGLGKTIQTLTRIVEGKAKLSDKNDGWSASTLVICPLALVGQWADEIERMTEGLRVIKHQGTSRTNDPTVLRKHHVVVTTYDTVKSEYEAYSGGATKKGKAKAGISANNGGDDDDDDDESDEPVIKKTTRKTAPKKMAIYGVKWWRIVLDEAHNIKNHKTKGAIACCALEAKWRWCLTGTPMQNNVSELFSLIKFLKIKPLNEWEKFNAQIAKPVSSGKGAQKAIQKLQVILKATMLRRQKTDKLNGKVLIQLPARNISIVSCPFDPQEKVFYESLETKMQETLEKILEKQGQGNGSVYISVLLLFLRLRQACNHPSLVTKDYKQDTEAIQSTAAPKGGDDQDPDADDLAMAFGQLGVTKKCQMCTAELRPGETGEGHWSSHCLDCAPLAQQAKEAESNRPSSAKIRKVLELLDDIDERSKKEEKTIIFSQFTTMLDLLEPFLKDRGIRFVRYDGKMKPAEREASLNEIKSSKHTRVILISFKAGSTGLNLTACNNVILVDLWWNPALEDQAFDRAHRFGQKRDVNIFKLKIDETVEDRILLLQDKKRLLAAAALSGDKVKGLKLTMDDLLALFRGGHHDDDDED